MEKFQTKQYKNIVDDAYKLTKAQNKEINSSGISLPRNGRPYGASTLG